MLYDFSKTKEAGVIREAATKGYDAFLDALDEDTRAEWVDGKVEFMSPIALIHSRIGTFLLTLTYEYLGKNPIGEVLADGFQMKLSSKAGRVPDLIFVHNDNRDRLKETYLDGPADLVVEIVSPDSVRRDRKQKFKEYADAGIQEYWIIDTVRGTSEFYVLSEVKSEYETAPLDENGLFHSRQLPGLRINPEWFKSDTLPRVKSVLVEAGITNA